MALTLSGTSGVLDNSGAFVAGTAVASTSGTSIDFTSIPSWVKRITVMFNGVSTNSTSLVQIQIGNGSVVTTGYLSNGWSANTSNSSSTSGFLLGGGGGNTYERSGNATICLLGSNTWTFSYCGSQGTAGGSDIGGGYKALAGTLDRIRITTINGTDTFDAGSINILYE